MLAAIGAGAAWRLAWVLRPAMLAARPSEALNLATTFAHTGVLADAYGPGLGPTAHLSPVMPMLGGLVYRTLGVTNRAEIILVVIAISLASVSFVFADQCFKRLGMPRLWRLASLAFVALAPINAVIELRQLRLFEGLLAAAMSTGLLLWILTLSERPRLTIRDLAPLAVAAGFLGFVNQAAALGIYGAAAVLVMQKVELRRWPLAGLTFAAALAAFLLPWGLRNEAELHHFVLTRSNFGLELAQSYYPGAVNPPDPGAEFRSRHDTIHPFSSPAALVVVRRVGETEYAAALGRQSMDWIRAHPGDAAHIALRNLRQFWFPDPWQWSPFGGAVVPEYMAKSIATWIIGVLGFFGLMLGLRQDWTRWTYVALATVLPCAPYLLVQPVPRYRYLVSTLLVFLAFEGIRRGLRLGSSPEADTVATGEGVRVPV